MRIASRLSSLLAIALLSAGLLCALAAPLRAADPPAPAAPAAPLIGAIRWDAWYGHNPITAEVERSLAPPEYHFRLPFFATIDGPNVTINGDRPGIMEKEIQYAAAAGLNYWAFVHYPPDSPLSTALHNYLATPNKRGLRFCLIDEASALDATPPAAAQTRRAELLTFFQNPDYLTVAGNRPLYFVLGAPRDPHFITTLDDACHAAHLPNPFTVLMHYNPIDANAQREKFGFDAISAYALGNGYTRATWSYDHLTHYVETQFWQPCADHHIPTLTFATAGWDPRPRLDHPVTWYPAKDPTPNTPAELNATATPAQLAAHLHNAITWTETHRDLNRANAILIYAWNENDEGGWLIPTLAPNNTPDTSRIGALQALLLPK